MRVPCALCLVDGERRDPRQPHREQDGHRDQAAAAGDSVDEAGDEADQRQDQQQQGGKGSTPTPGARDRGDPTRLTHNWVEMPGGTQPTSISASSWARHRRPVSLARDVKLRLALEDDAILEHA